ISTMSYNNSGWLINDSQTQPTFSTPGAVSNSLTWETVTSLDVGLDASFFERKMSLTFDWYERTTTGMLTAGLTLPATFGTSAPRRNFGSMRTRGWEVEVGWNHTFSENSFLSVKGTLSDFKEKITEFSGDTKQLPSSNTAYHNIREEYYEGMTLGEIWGYETEGFFTEDDFRKDANGNLLTN